MSTFEQVAPVASIALAFATIVVTAWLMHRQAREVAQERNALAILAAIDKVTSPVVVRAFAQLTGVNERYSTDEDVVSKYPGSEDDHANAVVGQYMETIACLARREVIDASLIVDAVGKMIRARWASIEPFILRRRRIERNDFIYENFEWLAKYSAWWKDVPRPRHPNYSSTQFL